MMPILSDRKQHPSGIMLVRKMRVIRNSHNNETEFVIVLDGNGRQVWALPGGGEWVDETDRVPK